MIQTEWPQPSIGNLVIARRNGALIHPHKKIGTWPEAPGVPPEDMTHQVSMGEYHTRSIFIAETTALPSLRSTVWSRQTPGYMMIYDVPATKGEMLHCSHSLPRPRHCQHFEEALYDYHLLQPGCMTFLPPFIVDFCTVQTRYLRRQQHSHHSSGAHLDLQPSASSQKFRGKPSLHPPKMEYHIVHPDFFRKRSHCHHSSGAQYEAGSLGIRYMILLQSSSGRTLGRSTV